MNSRDDRVNEKLRKYLDEQSKSMNETLSQARDFHFKYLHANLQQFLNFNIKLGELSLIISAAIGPIILVSNKEFSQPIFAFLALIIYLANGIFAIWRSKDIVEKQLDAFSPGNLYKVEAEVYPLQFSMDKLRFEPQNQKYIDEFVENRKSFLKNFTETEVPKRSIDLTLDIISLNFAIATILLVRTVWPFQPHYYWIFFVAILLAVVIFIIKSYIKANARAIQNEKNTKILNGLKKKHIEWQEANFYKNPNLDEKN